MNRKGQGRVAALALAGVVVTGLSGCRATPSQEVIGAPSSPQAADLFPEPTPPRIPEGFLGVVVAREAVDVASEVTGRLESVAVRVGDPVPRGGLLARLDTSLLTQDLAMAEAALKAAEAEVARSHAQLVEAETRHQRRAAIPDTFSKEELAAVAMEQDTAEAAHAATDARAAEQRVRVEQLRRSLARAEIRAPFDGTVALRYLDPGATVVAGAPVVRLLNTEELLVRFAVPPEEIAGLELDQEVEIRLADGDLRLAGEVRRIAPEIDAASRMVFVEAAIEQPQPAAGRLRSGMVARVVAHPSDFRAPADSG